MKKHLILIQGMLFQNEIQKAIQYLGQYTKEYQDKIDMIEYSKNYVINTLIQYYVKKAESSKIDIRCVLREPDNLFIKEADLCVVFGNCLENAIEACLRVPENERYISIRTKVQHKAYIITIDNSFDGVFFEENGRPLSRKENGGTGFENIKSIAKKYHGIAEYKAENDIFLMNIVLMLTDIGE